MTFPLFHRPGTVVFLDDDPDYLEMLALVLPGLSREPAVRVEVPPEIADSIDATLASLPPDLAGYLTFVTRVLEDHQRRGAVAASRFQGR